MPARKRAKAFETVSSAEEMSSFLGNAAEASRQSFHIFTYVDTDGFTPTSERPQGLGPNTIARQIESWKLADIPMIRQTEESMPS